MTDLRVVYAHSVDDDLEENGIGVYKDNNSTIKSIENIARHCTRYAFEEFYSQSVETERKGSCADSYFLTFDDGYKNFIENVIPVLEKYDTKAILFVTSGFVNGECYPYEYELARLISQKKNLSTKNYGEVDICEHKSKIELYNKIRIPLKVQNSRLREKYLDDLSSQNCTDRSSLRDDMFLSRADIKMLDKHPLVTIGVHTHTHTFLPSLSMRDLWGEIRKSKKELERIVGHSIKYFSYPYGGLNPTVKFMVRLFGFRFAFTTKESRLGRYKKINLAIPRLDIDQLFPDGGV